VSSESLTTIALMLVSAPIRASDVFLKIPVVVASVSTATSETTVFPARPSSPC